MQACVFQGHCAVVLCIGVKQLVYACVCEGNCERAQGICRLQALPQHGMLKQPCTGITICTCLAGSQCHLTSCLYAAAAAVAACLSCSVMTCHLSWEVTGNIRPAQHTTPVLLLSAVSCSTAAALLAKAH